MTEIQSIVLPRRVKDLTGQVFGDLVVISFAGLIGSGHVATWNCQCKCGSKKVMRSQNLRNGHSTTCGRCTANMSDEDYEKIIFSRLMAGVKKVDSGCWEWQKSKSKDGYGHIRVRNVLVGTHIIAYRNMIAPVPKGISVLHTCDNRKCCNPDHLWLGTQQENIADMNSKGRHARGETNGQSKLTQDQVDQIRAMYVRGKIMQKEIASKFGIDSTTVCHILKRNIWK